MKDRAFDFIPINRRDEKPRKTGMTEIRGPYYAAVGPNYMEDLFQTMSHWIDGYKWSGGSFALMPREIVKGMNELAHQYDIYVSTGGWVEHVLRHGPEMVDRYVEEAKALGFDVVELSVGFISLPTADLTNLIQTVKKAGLKPKPELGIQFGAGGATDPEVLEQEGVRSADWIINRAEACFDAGAEMIHIESEGITEEVRQWRTDVPAQIIDALGLERCMFEAADPDVFQWYIKNYGPEVNLFVDHAQIVELECLRSGIWGTQSTFGRIHTYKP